MKPPPAMTEKRRDGNPTRTCTRAGRITPLMTHRLSGGCSTRPERRRHDMVTHYTIDDLRVALGFAKEVRRDESGPGREAMASDRPTRQTSPGRRPRGVACIRRRPEVAPPHKEIPDADALSLEPRPLRRPELAARPLSGSRDALDATPRAGPCCGSFGPAAVRFGHFLPGGCSRCTGCNHEEEIDLYERLEAPDRAAHPSARSGRSSGWSASRASSRPTSARRSIPS